MHGGVWHRQVPNQLQSQVGNLVTRCLQRICQSRTVNAQGKSFHPQARQAFDQIGGLRCIGLSNRQVYCYEDICRKGIFQGLPGLFLVGSENEHDMIQPGLQQPVQVCLVCQAQPICQKARHLAVRFGMGDQVGQVIAQSRLAACEDYLRDAHFPGLIQDGFPFGSAQFLLYALVRSDIRSSSLGQPVGDGAIQAVRRRNMPGERRLAFETQERNWIQVRRVDQNLDAVRQFQIILAGLFAADVIAPGHLFCHLLRSLALHQVVGIFCSRLVQMQDRSGIDDQDAVPVRFNSQVQPVVARVVGWRLVVIYSRCKRVDWIINAAEGLQEESHRSPLHSVDSGQPLVAGGLTGLLCVKRAAAAAFGLQGASAAFGWQAFAFTQANR